MTAVENQAVPELNFILLHPARDALFADVGT